MRAVMRRAKDEGVGGVFMLIFTIPLNFLRDYSCPAGEVEEWNRNRAAILPLTIVGSFFFLNGSLDPAQDNFMTYVDITLYSLIPGLLFAFLIRFRTRASQPPAFLMTLSSICCFVMSIMWIQFTSSCIIDMLQLLGWIT
mmetsp:Transcript_4570/g.6926  ORF Transcript_4570/g.6926 Transcript_4570/m.6926 type:complete len:140 (+) Transcript_4570:1284-1703(+)